MLRDNFSCQLASTKQTHSLRVQSDDWMASWQTVQPYHLEIQLLGHRRGTLVRRGRSHSRLRLRLRSRLHLCCCRRRADTIHSPRRRHYLHGLEMRSSSYQHRCMFQLQQRLSLQTALALAAASGAGSRPAGGRHRVRLAASAVRNTHECRYTCMYRCRGTRRRWPRATSVVDV